tara:strand:+ start:4595 stop:5029 length:435 start_codon:yes stop_codon:yes gene_type:complete
MSVRLPTLAQLEETWEEAYELGYDNIDENRFELWDDEKFKYNDTLILGTWKQPNDREKHHMNQANHQITQFSPETLDYVCWMVASEVHRIRTPQEEGGTNYPPTERALAEVAYNLGGIGGIRVSDTSHIPPPLKNYIDLRSEIE